MNSTLSKRLLLLITFALCFHPGKADLTDGLNATIDLFFKFLIFAAFFIAELVVFIRFLRRKKSELRIIVQFVSASMLGVLILLCFHPVEKIELPYMIFGFIYFGLQLILSFTLKTFSPEGVAGKTFVPWHAALWLLLAFGLFKTFTSGDLPTEVQLAYQEDANLAYARMRVSLKKAFPDLREINPQNFRASYQGDSLVLNFNGYHSNTIVNIFRDMSYTPSVKDTLIWIKQALMVLPLLSLEQLNFMISNIHAKNFKIINDITTEKSIWCYFPFEDQGDQLIMNYTLWDHSMRYMIMKPWQLMPSKEFKEKYER